VSAIGARVASEWQGPPLTKYRAADGERPGAGRTPWSDVFDFGGILRRVLRRPERTLDDVIAEGAEKALRAGKSWDDIGEAIRRGTEDSGVILADALRRLMPRMIRQHSRVRRRFERNLRRRWRAALDLYYAFYVGCLEVGEEFSNRVADDAAAANDYQFEALRRLHARACVVASEVFALLRTGHAAGAGARARTLHEIAVVGYVLKQGTAGDSERYLLHAVADAWRRALVFQAMAHRLGEEPLSSDEMDAMRDDLARLTTRFGPEFARPFGWAVPLVGKPRPTFRDLEEHVALDHIRPYYQWFSEAVHASAKATESVLIVRGPHKTLLAGPSDAGLADPAILAMTSLFQITTTFVLGESPSAEELVMIHAIRELQREAEKEFVEADRRLEDETAIEWDVDAEA
jgi:hypothetical protein